MKKTNLLLLFVMAALTLSLNSCKKEDDDKEVEKEPTKSELIVGKWTWDKTEQYTNGTLQDSHDGDGGKIEFQEDHTIVWYDASGTPDPSFDYNKWELNADEDLLFFVNSEDNEALVTKLEKLTESELIFSIDSEASNGDARKIMVYLSK